MAITLIHHFNPVPYDLTTQRETAPEFTRTSESCDNQKFHDVLSKNNET